MRNAAHTVRYPRHRIAPNSSTRACCQTLSEECGANG